MRAAAVKVVHSHVDAVEWQSHCTRSRQRSDNEIVSVSTSQCVALPVYPGQRLLCFLIVHKCFIVLAASLSPSLTCTHWYATLGAVILHVFPGEQVTPCHRCMDECERVAAGWQLVKLFEWSRWREFCCINTVQFISHFPGCASSSLLTQLSTNYGFEHLQLLLFAKLSTSGFGDKRFIQNTRSFCFKDKESLI